MNPPFRWLPPALYVPGVAALWCAPAPEFSWTAAAMAPGVIALALG